jgi:hypothetical protein
MADEQNASPPAEHGITSRIEFRRRVRRLRTFRRKRRARTWLLGLGCVMGALLAVELFCRYGLELGDPPLSRADPEIEYMFVGPRAYHRFGNRIEYNSFSQRSREFDGRRKDPSEIRIMVVGDSVINGGALTDQSELATTLLEKRLTAEFQRPTIVMNVSAGSWGPPNYLAYVKRFGFFEINALAIEVSAHDFADSPTWEPVIGTKDFPDRTPLCATVDLLDRYVLPHVWGLFEQQPVVTSLSQGQIDQALGAYRELIALAEQRKIPVMVFYHAERNERGQPEGMLSFQAIAKELDVPFVSLAEAFSKQQSAGPSSYRDNIHYNALGQKLMADAMYAPLARAVDGNSASR